MLNGVLNCWDSSGNTLSICDLLIRVKGDVEIDLLRSKYSSVLFLRPLTNIGVAHSDQDPLALKVNIGNGELVGKRHSGNW
jgi:hypothetical protein